MSRFPPSLHGRRSGREPDVLQVHFSSFLWTLKTQFFCQVPLFTSRRTSPGGQKTLGRNCADSWGRWSQSTPAQNIGDLCINFTRSYVVSDTGVWEILANIVLRKCQTIDNAFFSCLHKPCFFYKLIHYSLQVASFLRSNSLNWFAGWSTTSLQWTTRYKTIIQVHLHQVHKVQVRHVYKGHLHQVYKVHLRQVFKSEPPGVQLERGSRRSGRQSWSPGCSGSGWFCFSSEASLYRIFQVFHILT